MEGKRLKLNKKYLIVAAVVIVILVVFGYLYYSGNKFSTNGNNQTESSSNNVISSSSNNNDSEQTEAQNSSPSIEITSPQQGKTFNAGDFIKIKTNNTTDTIKVVVSSDKWGVVYEASKTSKEVSEFEFQPTRGLSAGTSGSVIVTLEKDGQKIVEKNVWVNF